MQFNYYLINTPIIFSQYLWLQVRADDRDPPDMGGTVTYKFVSTPGEKERFHVDPESGNITTAYVSTLSTII